MNRYYRRTFDKVRLSESRQEQIRSTLSSQYNTYQEEAGLMNSKTCALKPKHSRVLVVVAAIVMVMVFVGFTYGSRIIQLLGGGRLEEGRDSKGNNYSSMDTGFASDPVEVRDGQIYFILDGSDTNITDQCSEENFYRYESVDGNGYRHVVLIGGKHWYGGVRLG